MCHETRCRGVAATWSPNSREHGDFGFGCTSTVATRVNRAGGFAWLWLRTSPRRTDLLSFLFPFELIKKTTTTKKKKKREHELNRWLMDQNTRGTEHDVTSEITPNRSFSVFTSRFRMLCLQVDDLDHFLSKFDREIKFELWSPWLITESRNVK